MPAAITWRRGLGRRRGGAQPAARAALGLHVRLVRARALADRLPPLAVRRLVHARAAARSLCPG